MELRNYRTLTESVLFKKKKKQSLDKDTAHLLLQYGENLCRALKNYTRLLRFMYTDWIVFNGTEYGPVMTITLGCTEDGVLKFRKLL